jgi:hypothetical protein
MHTAVLWTARLFGQQGKAGRHDCNGEHLAGQQADLATLVFSDGSRYTGTLKNGTPHGLGTCEWTDGNKYDGEWRSGVMHGFGTYLWTSGQRYDGEWKVCSLTL